MDPSALSPGCSGRRLEGTGLEEVRGVLVTSWSSFYSLGAESTHALQLLLYIPRIPCSRNVTDKFTSTQPGGSQGPMSCQCLLCGCAHDTHLKLDLGLSNVGLAAASAGNLLCLGDLVPDSLCPCQSLFVQSRVMARTSALKSSSG